MTTAEYQEIENQMTLGLLKINETPGAYPMRKYLESREKLFIHSGIKPQSIIVETDGPVKNVHYLEMGAGKPLVMIHGGGSHASEWFTILKPLAKHYHIYAVDRPGCGLTDFLDYRNLNVQDSAVDFMKSFMDAVGLKRTMILGQSMGGYFSILFALKHPAYVEKLGLIGAPAGMNRYIPFPLRLMGTRGINKLMGKPGLDMVKSLHKQLLMADVSRVSDWYLRHTWYHLQLDTVEKSFHSLLENLLSLRGWKRRYFIGNQLNRLDIPVRFIWGDQDAFEPYPSGQIKATAIRDYQFEVVKDAGHCVWLDQPEECVSLIQSML